MNASALPDTIGAKDLARLLGLTVTRISALAKDGVIPKKGRNSYPLPEAVAAYVTWRADHPDGRPAAPKDLNPRRRA
ncbi:MAG: hypothetical protein AAFU80_07555 [Pseudomonadota bacterium]